MRFEPTPIPGAFAIELERIGDDRGFFARSYCRDEFLRHGLNPDLAQCNISFNERRGTLRGMHYQRPPHAEVKLVRCTAGAIRDVIIDLRRESPAFRRWFGIELSAANRRQLYVPEGCAHGFVTLEPATEVFYQMSHPHHPESACGVRWDDPAIGVTWPCAPLCISGRDKSFPLL